MSRRPHTDWNHEPADPDSISLPDDDRDTEGHGILPNPAKLGKARESASRASSEQDGTDGVGPVEDGSQS